MFLLFFHIYKLGYYLNLEQGLELFINHFARASMCGAILRGSSQEARLELLSWQCATHRVN